MARVGLGITIRQRSVSVAEVAGTSRGLPRLLSFRSKEIVPPEDGADRVTAVSAALRELVPSARSSGAAIIVGFPAEKTSVFRLKLPFTDVTKVRRAIKYEVESHLAFPVEEAVVDFYVTGRGSGQDVVAVAARKERVSETVEILKRTGIDCEVLEPDSFAFHRALTFRSVGSSEEAVALVEIGLERVLVSITCGGEPELSLATRCPGTGESGSSGEHFYVRTLRHAVASWQAAHPEKRLGRIVIAGPGSRSDEARRFLENDFGIPVAEFDPLEVVTPARGVEVGRDELAGAATTLGLALRVVPRAGGRESPAINLLQEEFTPRLTGDLIRRTVTTAVTFCAVVAVLGALRLGYQFHSRSQTLRQLDAEVRGLFLKAFPDKKSIAESKSVAELMSIVEERVGKNRERLAGMGAGSVTVLDVVREISSRMGGQPGTRITELVIEGQSVRIRGTSGSLAEFMALRENLVQSSLFKEAKGSRAETEKGGVEFDLTLTVVPAQPGVKEVGS